MEKKKWYQGTPGAILFLIVFFPVGLFLMWKHTSWSKMAKGIVSGFFAVLAVIVLIQGPSEEPQSIMPPAQDATVANPQQDTPPTDTLATTPTEDPQLSDEQQAEVGSTDTPGAESKPELKPVVGSDLFENVYVPYALKEKTTVFGGVKSLAESGSYKYEITEPTEEVFGEIKILSNENDDYVYFAFFPNTDGLEVIALVNYFHSASNSEVSLKNYSKNRDPARDEYTTHIIGESDELVSGVDEQRTFLFAN